MSIGQIIKYENCSHDIDKYLDGIFVKDDYCYFCLDTIEQLESE
mgnify:FL=1